MELKNEFIEAGVVAEGGAMDVTGIVLLMRRLFDWLSRREEWALLAYLYKHDIKSTGKFSFQVNFLSQPTDPSQPPSTYDHRHLRCC
jgi:cell division ATPase FtsA